MYSITTLFLDIGGVLLENGWGRAKRAMAARVFGLDLEDFNERHHLTFDTYEQGKIDLETYLDRVVFYQERPFTRKEFRDFMLATRPFPEMIELVRNLKREYRLKTVVVSNEGRELTVHRIQKYGLINLMDLFVVSSFVHIRKPDQDLYQMALDLAQASPENTVYVEDRAMFVEVARKMGITGVHHTGYEETRKALESLGLALKREAK